MHDEKTDGPTYGQTDGQREGDKQTDGRTAQCRIFFTTRGDICNSKNIKCKIYRNVTHFSFLDIQRPIITHSFITRATHLKWKDIFAQVDKRKD